MFLIKSTVIRIPSSYFAWYYISSLIAPQVETPRDLRKLVSTTNNSRAENCDRKSLTNVINEHFLERYTIYNDCPVDYWSPRNNFFFNRTRILRVCVCALALENTYSRDI